MLLKRVMPAPALVIHGGAGGPFSAGRLACFRRRLDAVSEEAYACLAARTALEAVVLAVERLEDEPLFNAGTGSVLQQDGLARMSSSVMDGARRRFAGVLNIERVRHPVAVARALLEEEDRVLAGAGALRFARAKGHRPWNPVTRERHRQWLKHRADRSGAGTVGAVALDRSGRLAAATSTGGKGFERVGRISDSGLPVGNYADEGVAISCTGLGEDMIDEGLALRIAQRISDGFSLPQALRPIFRALVLRHRRAALIAVDRRGRPAWATTLPLLLAVAQTPERRLRSF